MMDRTACGKYSITGNMERGSELSFNIRNCVFCEGKNAEEYSAISFEVSLWDFQPNYTEESSSLRYIVSAITRGTCAR